MFQGQVAEEQIGEVRTVKSLGHEDHAKELYLSATAATYKTRVLLALVTAPLEGMDASPPREIPAPAASSGNKDVTSLLVKNGTPCA